MEYIYFRGLYVKNKLFMTMTARKIIINCWHQILVIDAIALRSWRIRLHGMVLPDRVTVLSAIFM